MTTRIRQPDGSYCYVGPGCSRHGGKQRAPLTTIRDESLLSDELTAPAAELAKCIAGYWQEQILSPELNAILSGKEPGHAMSSYVDERTVEALVAEGYDVHHEVDPKTGEKRTRSFGDAWLNLAGKMTPLNIKSGVYTGKGGQPNMVSVNRLKEYLLSERIDAYYLAIVKVDVRQKPYVPKTYFVNLLDHLDCAIANFGTGQVMLNEKKFFSKMDAGQLAAPLTQRERVESLGRIWGRALEEAQRKLAALTVDAADFENYLNLNAKRPKPATAFGPQLQA